MIRYLALITALFVAGCGFSPMYGSMSNAQNTAAERQLSNIGIEIIPNREGQFLRNALMDRFYRGGNPTNPAYVLKISRINESISDFDITIESEATRRQLRLTTNLNLVDSNTSETVLQRPLEAITSHNVLESEFSTLVTEQSAREAALNDLARQIERQLTLYFSR